MQKSLSYISLALLAFFGTAIAAEPAVETKPWMIMGDSAQISCGKFVALYNDNPLGKSKAMTWNGEKYYGEKYVYLQWAWGFVTGMNLSQPNSAKQIRVDADSLELWIKNTCEANPTKMLVDVLSTFGWEQLRGHVPPANSLNLRQTEGQSK